MVAAGLGVADRRASGPRSIADLSAANGCRRPVALSTGSCAATTGGDDDGRRLLSLLGWLHLIVKIIDLSVM